eukprot:gene28622-35510_t
MDTGGGNSKLTVCRDSVQLDDGSHVMRYYFGHVKSHVHIPLPSKTIRITKTTVDHKPIFWYKGSVKYDAKFNSGIWLVDGDEDPSKILNQDRRSWMWPGCAPHGRGISISRTGNRYDGDWTDGWREGQGDMFYRHDRGIDLYTGRWEKHQKHGVGAVLSGDWGPAMKIGQATLQLPNGDVYSGKFHSEYLTGSGTVMYSNGNVFEEKETGQQTHGSWTRPVLNADQTWSTPQQLGSNVSVQRLDETGGARYISKYATTPEDLAEFKLETDELCPTAVSSILYHTWYANFIKRKRESHSKKTMTLP